MNDELQQQATTPVRRFSWMRRLVNTRREGEGEEGQLARTVPAPFDSSQSIFNLSQADNASTRAMLSDREDYVDLDIVTLSSRDDDDDDTRSHFQLSSKSTAITSIGSTNLIPTTLQQASATSPILLNPGAASIHSSLPGAGPSRNDSASVITIASSSRDWRRRRSVDTNSSTNAIPPNSVLDNPI